MILLDASGSMSGQSFELAIATVSAILDTLSDNDFVNLIAFSDKTRSVVPCFKDKMVNSEKKNKINRNPLTQYFTPTIYRFVHTPIISKR